MKEYNNRDIKPIVNPGFTLNEYNKKYICTACNALHDTIECLKTYIDQKLAFVANGR